LRKTGFTLVEVLVASTIGAFVALVAVGTLRTISVSAEMVENNINTAAEVRFALNMIARDLTNFYRDPNIADTKFVGTFEESSQGDISYLCLYTVGRTKARIDYLEGDVYEVEYSLLRDEDRSVLCRRLWPNPDKYAEPGGILTVIAENIGVFQIGFFDGTEWQTEWPEDAGSLPELVAINIAAQQPAQADIITASLIFNFASSRGQLVDVLQMTTQGQ